MSHALVGQVEYRISTAYLSHECNKNLKYIISFTLKVNS